MTSVLQSESAHCKYKSLCLATYVFTASLVTPKQSSRDLRSSSRSYQLQHGSSGPLLLRCRQYASLGQSCVAFAPQALASSVEQTEALGVPPNSVHIVL